MILWEKRLSLKVLLTKQELTEARVAEFKVVIGPETFRKKVLAISGEELGWMVVLRFLCKDPQQMERVANITRWKKDLQRIKSNSCLPQGRKVQSGCLMQW